MKISTVVPFLNEEENLPVLYERLKAVFDSIPEEAEFLFIDDGSTDPSFQGLEKLRAADPRIRVLQFSRNFGHQAAITAGLDHATGDAVIIMDADLQDPPEVLPDLLAKWREGFEVVYAVRRTRDGEGAIKKFLAATFYRIFKGLRESHRYMRAMTSWVGFKQCAVEYDRAERFAGETKYPVWKSMKLAWDGLTSFSATPLQWMMNAGLVVALIAAVMAIRIIWLKLSGADDLVSGWASQSVLILFLGGVQLAGIGLLGQYISRIFDESKNRPLYLLRGRPFTSDDEGLSA